GGPASDGVQRPYPLIGSTGNLLSRSPLSGALPAGARARPGIRSVLTAGRCPGSLHGLRDSSAGPARAGLRLSPVAPSGRRFPERSSCTLYHRPCLRRGTSGRIPDPVGDDRVLDPHRLDSKPESVDSPRRGRRPAAPTILGHVPTAGQP